MLTLRCLAFALLLIAPVLAHADKPVASPPATAVPGSGARLVPSKADGKDVGYKVYAIKKGARFDQAHFENGDLLMRADGFEAQSADGARAIARIVDGSADVKIEIQRKGTPVTLTSKALR